MPTRLTGFAHRRTAVAKPSSPVIATIIALFAFVIAATALLLTYRQANGISLRHPHQASPDASRQFSACIDATFKTIRVSTPDTTTYTAVWRLCGEQIYDIDALNDFVIRKDKFAQQELDERVILFLVVAITLSGVCLAGLQLLASYKLAARRRTNFTEESSLSLEHDKVSLRSSVTGLMILALSLGFFIIYVKWVYTIREIGIEPPPTPHQEIPTGFGSGGPLLDVNGGLGAPSPLASPIAGAH